jgi:hypothetical protein
MRGLKLRRLLITLLVIAAAGFAGEVACRVKYYRLHSGDLFYLVTPFYRVSQTNKTEHGLFLPDSIAIRYGIELRDYPDWANTGYGRPCMDNMVYSGCRDDYLPMTYNSFCWRGPEITVEKPAGTCRIFAVGGSTMENTYLPDADLATTILDSLLRVSQTQWRDFEVIDAGHAAYDCARINQMLGSKAALFRPDILLYVEAFNEQVEALEFFQVEQDMNRLAAEPLIGPLHRRLYLRSMLYTYVVEKIYYGRRENQLAYYDEQPSRECFVRTVADCRRAGIEFIYVTQPINLPLVAGDGADLTNETVLRELSGKYYNQAKAAPFDRRANEMLRGANQRLIDCVQRQLCDSLGVPVLDIREMFESQRAAGERLFTDIVHRTCSGEKLLARGIAAGLLNHWAAANDSSASAAE